jgi:hypothetical protein
MSIAKMLAEAVSEPAGTVEVSDHSSAEESEGEDAAIEEILDAFRSNSPQDLKVALKSFIEMCRNYH